MGREWEGGPSLPCLLQSGVWVEDGVDSIMVGGLLNQLSCVSSIYL